MLITHIKALKNTLLQLRIKGVHYMTKISLFLRHHQLGMGSRQIQHLIVISRNT